MSLTYPYVAYSQSLQGGFHSTIVAIDVTYGSVLFATCSMVAAVCEHLNDVKLHHIKAWWLALIDIWLRHE